MFKTLNLLIIAIFLAGCVAGEVGKDSTTAATTATTNPSTAIPNVVSATTTVLSTFGGGSTSIQGTDFVSGATASIGSATCTVGTTTSSNLDCSIPSTTYNALYTSGAVSITVINPNTFSETQAGIITFSHPTPILTSFTPSTDVIAGGATLTVTGQYFRSSMTIDVAGVSCTPVTIVDNTTASCLTGASATPVDSNVVVTNTATDAIATTATSTGTFVYTSAAPTLVGLLKEATPLGSFATQTLTGEFSTVGGEQIVISGTGFFTDTVIDIDGTNLTTTYVSSTVVRATSTALTTGSKTIRVTNGDAQSATGTYTVVDPVGIVSLANGLTPSVSYGPPGGVAVSMAGNFDVADNYTVMVNIGGTLTSCTNPAAVTTSELGCVAPGADAGTTQAGMAYYFSIQDADNLIEATTTQSFTWVQPPSVTGTYDDSTTTSVTAVGSYNGGGTLSVTGAFFQSGASVVLDPLGTAANCSAVSVTTVSNQEIINCTTAAHAVGLVDVVITNPDNQVFTSTGAWEYVTEPTISGVANMSYPTISYGPLAGSLVTITGSNFDSIGGVAVTINGLGCIGTPTQTGTTQIDCVAPTGTAGTYDVAVTNSISALAATSTGAWTYIDTPSITGAFNRHTNRLVDDISSGPQIWTTSGEHNAYLTGSNFGTSTPSVTFGGLTATPTAFTTTTVNVEVPDGAAIAAVYVEVTSADGQTMSLTNAYDYIGAPTISGITPTFGGATLTTSGTISTTGVFNNAYVIVNIGGLSNAGTYNSVNSIGFTASPTASGVADVILRQADGQEATLTAGFAYLPEPTISSFTPAGGFASGGTTVTITGTNFIPSSSTTVIFDYAGDDTSCVVDVTGSTDTNLVCLTASHSGGTESVTFRVTNPDSQYTSTGTFQFRDVPVLSNVAHPDGPFTGGNVIDLSGSGFFDTNLVTVTIDPAGQNISCPLISNTATTAQCTVAAGSYTAGTYDVLLQNSDSQGSTLAGSYTITNPPVVGGPDAATGFSTGSNTLNVTGTGFLTFATPTVIFDYAGVQVEATITGAWTTTNIPVSVGAHTAAGPVGVSVMNYDQQTGTIDGVYTWVDAPDITSVTPSQGQEAATTFFTITGTGFYGTTGTTSVNLDDGGAPVACTVTSVTGGNTIGCTIPASQGVRTYNAIVQNPDTQQSAVTSAGTYSARGVPTITDFYNNNYVSAKYGTTAGGTTLKVEGTNFYSGGMTVAIDGSLCTGVSVASSTALTCSTPAHASATGLFVGVGNDVGDVSPTMVGWAFTDAPTITVVNPTTGFATGGTGVTLTGSNFDTISPTAISVTFDPLGDPKDCAIPSPSTDVTATSIYCITEATASPGHADGSVNVRAIMGDGQTDTLNFSYTYRRAPVVSSIDPTGGDTGGGTDVTVTGTYFNASTDITVGSKLCTAMTVVDNNTITCTTPANTAAAYDVAVTNFDTQVGTGTGLYTYTALPIVSFLTGAASPTPPNPDAYGSLSTNVTHTFTIQNLGSAASNADLAVNLVGANPASWFIATNNCSGGVAASSSCTIQVTYLGALLGTGAYTATLEVSSVTDGFSVTNDLTGSTP